MGGSIYVSPSDAVVLKDVMRTSGVQQSIKSIKVYKSDIRNFVTELSSNTQADLIPGIRKTFEFSKLRNDMNTFGTSFDEDTQRSIDRISRLIIQDVTELEAASAFKGGGRSEKRDANVLGKLKKLDGAFGELLAYTSTKDAAAAAAASSTADAAAASSTFTS